MNPIGKELDQSVRVDYQYFIELAVQKKLSWNTLVHFLTDLAPTLDKSRQVIRILVQELEKWVTKVENEIEEEIIAPNDIDATKEPKNSENSLASSEMSDSEDESNNGSINSTDDCIIDETNPDGLVSNEKGLGQISNNEKSEEINLVNESEIFNTGHKFYESIRENQIETQNDDSIKDLGNLIKSKKAELNSKESKEFKCKFCFKTFSMKYYLERHEKVHTGLKPYKCNTCNYSSERKSNVRKHENIHTGEKPFQCKHCEKSFNRVYNLKIHERIHTGERPYQCTTCEMSYTNLTNLKVHENTHSNDGIFQCKTCEKSFNQKSGLIYHERVHSNEKPYLCKICSKGFKDSSSLKRHNIIHTNDTHEGEAFHHK